MTETHSPSTRARFVGAWHAADRRRVLGAVADLEASGRMPAAVTLHHWHCVRHSLDEGPLYLAHHPALAGVLRARGAWALARAIRDAAPCLYATA